MPAAPVSAVPTVALHPTPPGPGVLVSLEATAARRGLDVLALELAKLRELVLADLAEVALVLDEREPPERQVARAAHHLLDLGGKRLRPTCVALAARCGDAPDLVVRDLAVAVELVHSATLLHDDVVDLGDTRRGAATPRAVYGNAASIFAGDWLLVEALRRVRATRMPDALDGLLDTIEEMIFAESLQLERRGKLVPDLDTWLKVARGKTASLFRWGMGAGARAGGLDDGACAALEAYGEELGVAFQAVDDLLDVAGDERATGKALFADLAEGKVTYPLCIALAREPQLVGPLAGAVESGGADAALLAELRAGLVRTGALDETRTFARARVEAGKARLAVLPPSRARAALAAVADSTVKRWS